jgi:hypothetical protein
MKGSQMAVYIWLFPLLPRPIWKHVCHSCAKRSMKPIRLPLKGSYQMQN